MEKDAEIGGALEETAASMQVALRRALTLPSPADQLTWTDPGQAVAAEDREGLERLCRYGLRAPFSRSGCR